MNAVLVQRQAALAGVALLGALGALALGDADEEVGGPRTDGPVVPQVAWQRARVSVLDASRIGRETACRVTVTEDTLGLAHPVLPCGVRLVLERDGREVEAEVVERRGVAAGRSFALTPALADELDVRGSRTAVRWRFAA